MITPALPLLLAATLLVQDPGGDDPTPVTRLRIADLSMPLPADWIVADDSSRGQHFGTVADLLQVPKDEFEVRDGTLQLAVYRPDPRFTATVKLQRGGLALESDAGRQAADAMRATLARMNLEIRSVQGRVTRLANREVLRLDAQMRVAGTETWTTTRTTFLPSGNRHALISQSGPTASFAERESDFRSMLDRLDFASPPEPSPGLRVLRKALIPGLSAAALVALAALVVHLHRRRGHRPATDEFSRGTDSAE